MAKRKGFTSVERTLIMYSVYWVLISFCADLIKLIINLFKILG